MLAVIKRALLEVFALREETFNVDCSRCCRTFYVLGSKVDKTLKS